MKRAVRVGLTLAAALCLSGRSGWAGVIYSNLGSPPTYSANEGDAVTGPDSGRPGDVEFFSMAMEFMAGLSGSVTQIDLALSWVRGEGGVTVGLMTDNGFPATELGSWHVTPTCAFGGVCDLVTISGLSGPTLTAGQFYFLVAIADDSFAGTWNSTDPVTSGWVASSTDQGETWIGYEGFLDAFDVLGGDGPAPVPEPATAMLLGAGLLGLPALARRRAPR